MPELLITIRPADAARYEAALADAALPKAALRPLPGCDAGARLHEGALAGSLGGVTAGSGLPRLPWTAVEARGVAVRSGYQPISRTQFEQMTRINPASAGGLGPHPVREPEPV